MNWVSASAFFAMGGYAVYVWGSVFVCALAIAGELVALRARRATIERVLRRRAIAPALVLTERTA